MYLNERDIFQESHRGKLAKRLLQTTPNMDLENQVLSRLKKKTDGETRRIEVIVTLLMYLNERDIFQESHRGKLAKRLLQTTPNMDLENQVLSRLQRSLGKTFTFKMEAMLRDFALTGELQRLYAADQEARLKTAEYSGSAEKAELAVHVLTASHWPAYRCDPMQAPKSLDACLRSFRHFYATQHASRTLSWVHALGTAQLQVLFPKGVKDITCSVFQASILLTIASASNTSGRGGTNVADVARLVNLALPMVKMHTASMYLHKVFPLLTLVDSNGKPCPPNKQFHEGDLLALNPGFVHKLRKFKLAAPVAAKKEGESGRQEIETLRKAQADAAIVRIMKSRRTLQFPELEEQACQQLSKLFVPPPKLLKLRVEDLISRGYLQRDESDRNKFHYIA
ncbi:cullin, putative [Bodo saltans]|uniref:Cullin, putative n=1 Tax=Bodo saltans TaxID=75058 RepID=A0A0S4KKK2_BODSA|nr:cullin, putative [Bodo saltans]|eukprot:CUI14883.1 cullin, putative [Bodo saltans]